MMKISKCVCLCLLAFLCGCSAAEPVQPAEPAAYSKLINTGKFAARNELEAPAVTLPPDVRAVIVPHGGEAIRMAAEVIAGLAQCENRPGTIILIGPNHTIMGPKIATTYAAFSAYDGLVLPREDLVRAVEGRGLAHVGDALFEDEHSLGILLPLLARYLPGARAAPLIFQKGASFNTAKQALDTLCELSGPGTVIVASIDFSHGLSSREERPRRAAILECIRAFDSAGVLGLDGTYIDAPVVLAALLQRMKEDGCAVELIAQANSSELLGREVPAATGYMTIVFYGGE